MPSLSTAIAVHRAVDHKRAHQYRMMLSSIGERHRLECLSKLLAGEDIADQDYLQRTLQDMLEVFGTARQGFEFLKSPRATEVLLWNKDEVQQAKYALHFEKLLGEFERAERIVRAIELAVAGYQAALAAYDTAAISFESPESKVEVQQLTAEWAQMAWHFRVLPQEGDDFEE